MARYGGEEFAVILPSTGAEGGLRAGERLRDAIRSGGIERAVTARRRQVSFAATGDAPQAPPGVVGEHIRRSVETERFGGAARRRR